MSEKTKVKIQDILEPYIRDPDKRRQVSALITLLFVNDLARAKVVKANIEDRIQTYAKFQESFERVGDLVSASEFKRIKEEFESVLKV